MSNNRCKVLVITAHPDDAEFICGGTLAKYASEGQPVAVVVMTDGDKWHVNEAVRSEEIAVQRQAEARQALDALRGKSIHFVHFADGSLREDGCIDPLIRLTRQIGPDIIITHSQFEKHPDHRQLNSAVQRICNRRGEPMPLANPRWCPDSPAINGPSRLYFHATLSEVDADDTVFVELDKVAVRAKIDAILCHKSQIRDAARLESQVWDTARMMGRFAGCELAEAFRPAPGFLPRKSAWLP